MVVSLVACLDIGAVFHMNGHVQSSFFFTFFLDIRVEDVSNLGGGWKIRNLIESRIYIKKDI